MLHGAWIMGDTPKSYARLPTFSHYLTVSAMRFWSPHTAKAPGQSSYSAATLAGGSTWNIAAIPGGSHKAVLKNFENVSELGSKRQ